jgi:hypothetical protein
MLPKELTLRMHMLPKELTLRMDMLPAKLFAFRDTAKIFS